MKRMKVQDLESVGAGQITTPGIVVPSTPIIRGVTGAFALMDSLKRHGVKHIFGYPGGAILPIYDELYRFEASGDLQHILVRHEQGAAHAADGYARATLGLERQTW
jgi:acetolactate synthase I/II/III large subunit